MVAPFSERQRISIARAFLKDAPIILLDEATASLTENETAIQEALSVIKHKTVLVIAYQMRTLVRIKSGRAVSWPNRAHPTHFMPGTASTPTWWICSRQARIGRSENDGGFYRKARN